MMSSAKPRKSVFVSSTSRDLPDHRKQAQEAILRMSMFPIMMEHLPPSPDDAIKASLEMCDEGDYYVGIFAHRYGYVPAGHDISITEMEYERAKARNIPRFIFIMDDDHPITGSDVEKGEGATKLEAFKNRVLAENIVNFFKSPEEIRAQIIHALSAHRERDTDMHFVRDIPSPPDAYIAHPYVLLPPEQLKGRYRELNLLTDWVAKPTSRIFQARMVHVVAIGGMGKSALTWKWFQDVAPNEIKSLAGRVWWSFYESDASFENFVIRSAAYVTGRDKEDIRKLPPSERESLLLAELNAHPYLLVLDGLERVLVAYSGMNAAYLADDDLDRTTANMVAGAIGLPASAADSYIGQHRLRKTIDPRAGLFLQKLCQVKASRVLVSTRLYPSALQLPTGHPVHGSFAIFLTGLSDDDALAMWRDYGVTGSREELTQLFASFDNYPLLIRALAGEVAKYRRAPGDFDAWRANNRNFNPAALPLVQRKSHVLQFALQELSAEGYKVLNTVAAFRTPATYDVLSALLVGADMPFASENDLDGVLEELEDRGLIGWDRIGNRYDLHPIVRGVTWDTLPQNQKAGVYSGLQGYFQAIPGIDEHDVEKYEDLTPAIELYNALLGMGRFDEALNVYRDRLSRPMLYRLNATTQRIDLLRGLFPDGEDALPPLSDEYDQGWAINDLAVAYHLTGQPGTAIPLYVTATNMYFDQSNSRSAGQLLSFLAQVQMLSGSWVQAEWSLRRSLQISRDYMDIFDESYILSHLGFLLGGMDRYDEGKAALDRAIELAREQGYQQAEAYEAAYLAQIALWHGDAATARTVADRVWEMANVARYERDFIRAARLQGSAALALGDLKTADERLHHALIRARAVSLVEEELPALTDLAEIHRQRGEAELARERLSELWELAGRGPYPWMYADGLNVLVQIERDAGNGEAVIAAATQAYRLAWLDGISADGAICYAYRSGLDRARAHLDALGAPIPDVHVYEAWAHDPIPEAPIDPDHPELG